MHHCTRQVEKIKKNPFESILMWRAGHKLNIPVLNLCKRLLLKKGSRSQYTYNEFCKVLIFHVFISFTLYMVSNTLETLAKLIFKKQHIFKKIQARKHWIKFK